MKKKKALECEKHMKQTTHIVWEKWEDFLF